MIVRACQGVICEQAGGRLRPLLRHSVIFMLATGVAVIGLSLPGISLRAQAANPVFALAYIDIKPALSREGMRRIQQYVRGASRDAGNESIQAVEELDRAGRFVILESWQDAAAFEAHAQSRNAADLQRRLQNIERSPTDLRLHHVFAADPAPAMPGDAALYVVTHVDVPGEHRQEAEGLLRELVDATRTAPGKLNIGVYQQYEPRTNHFTLVTLWRNRAAFDAYGDSRAWNHFMTAITPLLGAPYDERFYGSVRP